MKQGIKWSTLYSVFNLVYLDDIILFTKLLNSILRKAKGCILQIEVGLANA